MLMDVLTKSVMQVQGNCFWLTVPAACDIATVVCLSLPYPGHMVVSQVQGPSGHWKITS